MKTTIRNAFLPASGVFLVVIAHFPTAFAQDGGSPATIQGASSVPDDGSAERQSTLRQQVRLARFAREGARTSGADALVAVSMASSTAEEASQALGCPAGMVAWRRDASLWLCATLCSTDDECVNGEERCVVVDPSAPPAEGIVFAADVDAYLAELPVEEGAISPWFGVQRLCDPFWDLDADLGGLGVPQPPLEELSPE